jgi:hypothetical protein
MTTNELRIPTTNELRILLGRVVTDCPASEKPALIGVLAEALAQASMSSQAPPTAPAASAAGLVDAKQMAELLSVPENWVRDKARAGVLPSHDLGHYVRFEPAEVLEAVRKLPRLQNGPFGGVKKRKETRGGKRQVSTKCPSSPADSTLAR